LLFFACVYLRPEQETTEANPQLQVTLAALGARDPELLTA